MISSNINSSEPNSSQLNLSLVSTSPLFTPFDDTAQNLHFHFHTENSRDQTFTKVALSGATLLASSVTMTPPMFPAPEPTSKWLLSLGASPNSIQQPAEVARTGGNQPLGVMSEDSNGNLRNLTQSPEEVLHRGNVVGKSRYFS